MNRLSTSLGLFGVICTKLWLGQCELSNLICWRRPNLICAIVIILEVKRHAIYDGQNMAHIYVMSP